MNRVELASIAECLVGVECGDDVGSGAVVDLDFGQKRPLVLTCWHVLKSGKAPRIIVRTYNPKASVYQFESYAAVIIAQDRARDLALLSFRRAMRMPSLSISEVEPDLQEEVALAGNPCSLFGIVQPVRVQGKRNSHRRNRDRYLLVGALGESGASGGPLCDSNGDVIGVYVEGEIYNEVSLPNVGHAVTLPTLKRFLAKVKKGRNNEIKQG